jgi:hypothetical protein
LVDVRLKRSLERIKDACDSIEDDAIKCAKRGVRYNKNPIYLSAVGNRCVEKFGGPSAKSIIRNRQKEPLKSIYINLRANQLKLPLHEAEQFNPLEGISSESAKSYIVNLEAHNKYLEKRILYLTSLLKYSPPLPLIEVLGSNANQPSNTDLITPSDYNKIVPQVAFEAVQLILSSEHLKHFNLSMESGFIVDTITGEEFLNRQHVGALRSLIKS